MTKVPEGLFNSKVARDVKANTTNAAAKAIAAEEKARVDAKTARLRALRLEKEAREADEKPILAEARRKRPAKAASKP